jgi:biotin transporter BioY
MYYIWSLLTSTLLFAVIQFNEYSKLDEKKTYKLITILNLASFLIIYLLLTILFYMIFGIDYTCINKIEKKRGGNQLHDITIDPIMLRKISEPVHTGFHPYDNSDL